MQVAVPSRADVPAYEDEREEVEALIARINGKHPRANGSVPVVYMDTSLDEVEMARGSGPPMRWWSRRSPTG